MHFLPRGSVANPLIECFDMCIVCGLLLLRASPPTTVIAPCSQQKYVSCHTCAGFVHVHPSVHDDKTQDTHNTEAQGSTQCTRAA